MILSQTINVKSITIMHQTPLISVLIPTYNVEKYIEKAISSIINQSYLNLEIIIVDDASSDKTYEILEKMVLLDNRIRLFKNANNKKIVETLNYAFSLSRGEYIVRMDGDDISEKSKIEKQLQFLQENPEIDLVGINVVMIDENDSFIHNEAYPETHDTIVKASRFVSPIPHFWMAKRKVYNELLGYRIPTVEDYDFILRCIDFDFKLANLQEYLYYQRVRSGNTSTSSGLVQYRLRKYIRKLSSMRGNNLSKKDLFNENDMYALIKASKLNVFFFSKSYYFQQKYSTLKKKSIVEALFFRLLSILILPKPQIEQLYQRWRYKTLNK